MFFQLKQDEEQAKDAADNILKVCTENEWLYSYYPEQTLEVLKTAGRFYYWSSRHEDLRKITPILDSICEQPGLAHRYMVATKTVMYNYALITMFLDDETRNIGVDELEKVLFPIFDFLEENASSISSDLIPVFYINFGYFYFMLKDYSKALKWTNKILELSNQELRDDVVDFTHLLRSLLLYEQGEWEVCTYSLQQLARLLKGRKTFRFFYITQALLKKLIASVSRKENLALFQDYAKELQVLEKDPEELKALLYFDLRVWASRKIEELAAPVR